MKSMRLEGVGQLFTREVDKPAPGPDDLLVRVEACGVCGTDRHLFHGEFPSKPPVTLGHEFAGIIEAMGQQVTGFAIGDRILRPAMVGVAKGGPSHAPADEAVDKSV